MRRFTTSVRSQATDELAREKARWRERYSRLREQVRPEDRERLGEAAADRLAGLDEFQRAASVALFASFVSEIPTAGIATRASAQGKQVLYPRVPVRDGLLVFHTVGSPGEMVPGPFGILEPRPDPATAVPLEEIGLIVVPGLVFDRTGFRVGYGGGYYDRVLASTPEWVRGVGFAFDFQVADSVPHHEGDRKVHWLVTDARTIPFSHGGSA